MDILTHGLSGVAVGTCLVAFSSRNIKYKLGIIGLSGLGGILPDIDVISLWSGFDRTFGKWFSLQNSGKDIYSADFWYSHHGFMHSLFAALIIPLIVILIYYFIRRKKKSLKDIFSENSFLIIGFIVGYILHLLEDMPTPGGPWRGIRLFFPFKIYVGGTGNIWWWNNYDIFLVVCGVISLNLLLLFCRQFYTFKVWKYTSLVFILGFVLIFIQIKNRGFDFNRKTYQVCEEKSKEIQQKILGENIYKKMDKFDRSLKVQF